MQLRLLYVFSKKSTFFLPSTLFTSFYTAWIIYYLFLMSPFALSFRPAINQPRCQRDEVTVLKFTENWHVCFTTNVCYQVHKRRAFPDLFSILILITAINWASGNKQSPASHSKPEKIQLHEWNAWSITLWLIQSPLAQKPHMVKMNKKH